MVVLAALLTGAAAAYAVPAAPKGDVYALGTCPVSGEKLGSMGEPVVKQYDGREVRFCCQACVGKFEAKQEEYLAKVDARIVSQQKDVYPLETCVVSGEKLGGMGEPVDYVYKNRLVRFCCKGCVKSFEKDPAASLAKLDEAAIAKQAPNYPRRTCVVSGETLGSMGESIDYVTGNRLVRFCCKACVKQFEKDPAAYLDKLSGETDEAADGEPTNAH